MSKSGPKAADFSFPKAARLLKRSQFLALSARSARPDLSVKAGSFLVLGAGNGLDHCRLGVTVTKKVGSAVVRNALKRRVREFFRLNSAKWPQGLDLLFIARHSAAERSAADLRADLERAGRKLTDWGRGRASGPGESDRGPSEGGRAVAAPKPEAASAVENEAAPGPFEAASPSRPLGPGAGAAALAWPPEKAGPLEEMLLELWRLPSRLALGFIFFYQKCISPLLPPCCRFRPTCSCYAAEAVKLHGFLRGSYLAARRLLKCHPFHPGGYDPVPPKK